MRIFTVYFQLLLILVLSISTTPLFGNNLEPELERNLLSSEYLVLPDTTCGLMDTLFQLTIPSCPGASDATATIQFEGNPDSLMIQWDNGVMGDTVTGLNAGLHFVTVTDNNSCMLIDSILIADKPIFDYKIAVNNSLCIGVSNGSISISDTTNLSYSWNTGDSTNTIDQLARGAYEVTINDGSCAIAETIIVEVDTQATIELIGTNATCSAVNDGSIAINDSLNIDGYSFLWSTGDTTNMLTNLHVGSYFVLASNSEGCLAADSINISATRGIPLESTIVNTSCEEVSDGSISINDTLDVTGLKFGWSTGDTTQSISNLGVGTYSVAISDSIGCLAGTTFNILANTPTDINLTSTNATCIGVNDGSVTITDTTGAEGFSILWNTGDSTQTISGLATGIYSVTVSDDSGCSVNSSIQVVADTTATTPTIDVNNVSCAGLTDGSIVVNQNTTDTTFSYVWNTNDSTNSLLNIGVGNYLVTITDGIGCISTDSINISANSLIDIRLNATNVSCSGMDNGAITINEGTDISGLTFAWNTGDSTQMINNLSTGNYIATVTDSVGCFAIDSVLIESDSSLQIGLTGNNINCIDVNDGRVSAFIIGSTNNDGLTFSWSTGDSTATISDLAPGDYSITVTDTSGCIGIGGVKLNEADTIDLVLVVSELSCMDTTGSGGILAVATGGSGVFTYDWSNGDSTDTVIGLVAGTYSVTATDSLGCMVIDSATLVPPPDLIISTALTQAPTCDGTQDGSISVNVSGGTSPYAIRWNTGIITSTLENLNPGTYSVDVSDDAGCMVTDSITIEGSTAISLIISEINSASGQNNADAIATITASDGLAPYTFNWDNGAIGDTVTNLSPGSHDVVATDANGCTATGSIDVSFFELSVSIIETRNLTCNGSRTGRATTAPNNGTAPYDYIWSTGDTLPILTNLPAGTHSVTVTDAEGKKGAASVTLSEPGPINFNLEIIPPGCPTSANGRITIRATGTTGTPFYDFGVGGSTNPFILGVTVGTKRYSILDGSGCRADTVFTIESISANPPIPNFDVESIGLNASFRDSTTNEPFDYLWKFGDGTTSDEENPVHQYPDTGSYEVCLIVSNACATDSLCQNVRIAPVPVPGVELNFGRDTSSLSGQLISIPVTVGAFDGLAGFSGTFELTNPMIGEIQGVRDLNLQNLTAANIAFQDNLISINWTVPDTSQLVSLPTGTQIFVIDVLLTGTSNACTEIVGSNAETTLQFTKIFNGNLIPAPFVINSAEICIGATVSIAGNVSRESETNVSGVTVTTNGGVTSTTAADGNYALPSLPGGATFDIGATKSDELLLGVTTFDLVAILQHILTQNPLNSPYKIIAADVDNSGSVSSFDLVHLQRLILQKIDAFPNNQPWRFVPENYVFSNPTNPLVENFPETITVNRLEIDTTNIDFIAIKIGDVVDSQNSGARFLNKSMGFKIEEQSFKKGELVKIPFIFESKSAALGFQLELDFDNEKLAFEGATAENFLKISDKNIGTKDLESGRLKMLWINTQQLPIRPLAKGLFQLEFIALANGNLSSSLQLIEDQFPAQFYTQQNTKIGLQNIDLTINNARVETTEEVVQNNPPTQYLSAGEGIGDGGCSDGIDNDNDGLIDCADADCFCECNTTTTNNLILNPSAEMSLAAEGPWQSIQGTWESRDSNPEPQDGSAYFYAGDNEVGQLSQVIDLSADFNGLTTGFISYAFSGYVRSFDEDPSDQAQILIEFRNGSDSTLATFDSGLITSLSEWQLVTDTLNAPVGTSIAIINLVSRRRNGNNNDAYYDNLSLTKITTGGDDCVDPCENVSLMTTATNATLNGIGGSINATFSGATGPISYSWSNGDSTAEITNLSTGTYIVEASDSIGCTAMNTVEVVADSTFSVAFTSTPNTCIGDTDGSIIVEITGGTAPFTFSWADTIYTGDTLRNLASGEYIVTVTDDNGNMVASTATVASGANIQFNMTDSKVVAESCPSAGDGQLSLVAEGGTAPYQYILNGDTTNNGVYLGLNAGTYPVTISDASSCSTVDTIIIGNTNTGTLSADFTTDITDTSVNLSTSIQDTTATYAWTFGDGNSSTESNPSVTYTNPGSYEICLTITNACGNEMTCQTVSIGINGPVRFVLNGLNGIANDTVVVPITVENFVDIISYQKTIKIQDTSIARIVGISDPNLADLTLANFFQVDAHTVTTVWFDSESIGKTLPNNTVLYNLMVMIDSQVDTCVGINFVESPVVSQVVGIMGDEVAEVPYDLVNGEICTSESSEVSGNIARETGSAVPGVAINVSNFNSTSITDIDGNYQIKKLALNSEYEIMPTLNTPLLEGVSTFDIVLINRHILRTRLLDSPYKIIAADVNQSEAITVFDLVLIQRAILGLNFSFPGNTAWRFIPTSYEFLDPMNPLSEEFPESVSVNTSGGMLADQDFVAIKVADVSYNVPSLAGTATPRSSQKLTFNLTDKKYKAGDLVTIPVSAEDLNDFAGFQLELDFDQSELAYVDIKAVDLSSFDKNNVGVQHLKKGKLQMIWVAPSLDLPTATTTLFQLQFKAKSDGTISNAIQLANRYLPSESYTEDAAIGKLELNFEELKTTAPSALSVYPNPTKGILDLSFENKNKEYVQILMYNFTGQLVKEWKDITGENAQLNLSNHSDGTYMILLRKGEQVEVQTVILNK